MRLLITTLLLSSLSVVLSQDIKIKKQIIYDSGKAILKIEGNEGIGFSISNLNGEELIFMTLGTHKGESVWRITFVKEKKVLYAASIVYYPKRLVETLIRNGLLVDGVWHSEKLDLFITKYQISD